MKHAKKSNFFPFFLLIASFSAVPLFADQLVDGWNLTIGNNGAVTSMALTSPRTYLNIEQTIDIVVDYQGTPVRGTVKFRNGLQKDLNYPEEVNFYWDEFKGAHAIWEYLASMNRVELFNPDDATIPQMMYGRTARVISKAGNEYFGKLVEMPSTTDWFKLNINGSLIVMYRHAIAVIQVLK
jgi:hypothetical protein